MRKLILTLICVVGCVGLLAALHHLVVATIPDTGFARAFEPTCAWCHGGPTADAPAASEG